MTKQVLLFRGGENPTPANVQVLRIRCTVLRQFREKAADARAFFEVTIRIRHSPGHVFD
jgi:hypothetical protein